MEFREVARKKRALPAEACVEVLKTQKRGVLAVCGDMGYPYALPINYFYDAKNSVIYFHSGKTGHKTDAIRKQPKVSFCVYDEGYREAGEWALNIKSVIVFGKMECVNDYEQAMDICRQLSRKFTDDETYIEQEIEKFGKNTLVLALKVEHMRGKIVCEA